MPDEYGHFPLRTFLGMDVTRTGDGVASARVDVGEAHLNPNGVVHGAVLFALVDTAMGGAALSVLPEGQFPTSVDIQLRFVRPASAGRIVATAEVLKRGRHVIHLDARIHGEDERLVATAAGTFGIFGVQP